MTDSYHVALGPSLKTKIPYGSPYWREFNGSFENVEMPQVDIAAKLYDGHPITTCLKPPWRTSDNYYLGQHLGLDFDTEDARSSIPALMREPFIHKHGSIIYTTPSHTADKPRARVIFLLDTPIHQAVNYTLAATALLWIFGSADRQCKDPVRFFYGGRPGACEMEWPGNELPLSLVKDLIQRYQESGSRARHQVKRDYEAGTVEERKVVEALNRLDPMAMGYDDWLRVLMAIHSEFPGADGLRIAETWGEGKPKEIEQKWRSFKIGGNVSGRAGIGTLFAMAKERGWEA